MSTEEVLAPKPYSLTPTFLACSNSWEMSIGLNSVLKSIGLHPFHSTLEKQMSDLFHTFKLTEQWGHDHLKHTKAYQTLRIFFPCTAWLFLAHELSFAPIKQ